MNEWDSCVRGMFPFWFVYDPSCDERSRKPQNARSSGCGGRKMWPLCLTTFYRAGPPDVSSSRRVASIWNKPAYRACISEYFGNNGNTSLNITAAT